ncbi:hypothetical protein [Chromobacterium alticapitis]|uniref:Uncharacterized protein n=1 Tax=Chromobacterium alticapitis TaxID=2073169 RepID=A0A2S5DBU1_9NEIS|nr:hypothetical protein [Chromobacterium alticapitis]POZ60539.1 hypothetical protein C2I19_18400 [Chromobacterium alticapitis]
MRATQAAWLACWLALAQPAWAAPDAELAAARAEYWLHPYQPQAINRLALLLAVRGDVSSAELLLERALRIAPGRGDVRANLARLRAGERRVASAPLPAPAPVAAPVPARSPVASAPVAAVQAGPLPGPWPLPAEPPAAW